MSRRQTEFKAEFDGNPEPFNEKAKVLVVAMINAAKSDGRVDNHEQEQILEQLGEINEDETHFLRAEFAKSVDVADFVRTVPVGMEKQVYAVSLMAIDLDQNSEMRYLKELGRGFRLSIEECNRIHVEFGAPQMR